MNVRVPLDVLGRFSADGQVYRAFGHSIAAGRDVIVFAPLAVCDGDLTTVIDRCPIPWQEACAIIDDAGQNRRAVDARFDRILGVRFRDLAPTNWDVDEVAFAPALLAARLTHPSGIKVAAALPRILQSIEEVFRV